MWVKCLLISHLHFYNFNLDRFTFACKNALYFWYTSESFGHLPLSAASSHPPHTHSHVHACIHTTSQMNSASFALCHLLPLLFSSHPCFFFVSFPSLTFLTPSDDCGGDSSNETQGDIWRFQPTYFSLPPSPFFFQLILLPLLPQCCFFVFSSKFLLQHCCTFLEKGDRMLVKNFEFRFLCSCVVCVCLSLLRFI